MAWSPPQPDWSRRMNPRSVSRGGLPREEALLRGARALPEHRPASLIQVRHPDKAPLMAFPTSVRAEPRVAGPDPGSGPRGDGRISRPSWRRGAVTGCAIAVAARSDRR